MAHWKKMYNSEYLGSWDLDKEITVEILTVKKEEITGEGGRSDTKPVLTFSKATKRFILNKTNGKAIEAAYGTDTDGWIGKKIILFVATVRVSGEDMDAIRVKTPRRDQGFGTAT